MSEQPRVESAPTREELIAAFVDQMPPLVGERRQRVLAMLRDTRGTGTITVSAPR